MDVYAWVSPFLKNRRVTDWGCGRGDGMLIMSMFANHITGVDNNKRQIKYSYRHNPHYFCEVDTIVHDLNTGLPDTRQDIVTAFEVLEHLKDPAPLIRDSEWKEFYFSVPKSMPHPLHTRVFHSEEDVESLFPDNDTIQHSEIYEVNGDYRGYLKRWE